MASGSNDFSSLEALLTRQQELLPPPEATNQSLRGVTTSTIRDFLWAAATAGKVIIDPRERRVAQAIMRFWAAELITRGEGDWTLPALAAPQIDQIEAKADIAGEDRVGDVELDRTHALVQIAATARRWIASKDNGWLLKGQALREAEKYAAEDEDIHALVAASRAARRSMIKTAAVTTLVVLAFLVSLVCAVQWLAVRTEDRVAHVEDRSDIPLNQTLTLYLFGTFQRILPPPNFSRPSWNGVINGVHLPGLTLHAPNFSRLTLRDLHVDEAQLTGAAFTQSTIVDSSFARAQLSTALFREGMISSTSFAQATLDWAVFDRTVFTNVDFSEADLSAASFWSASFDNEFEARFKNTPWWFAQGWNSCQIEALNRNKPASSVLKQTRAFRHDTDDPRQRLAKYASGTPDRAWALNDLAWALATWGLDLQSPSSTSTNDDASCLTATGVPDDAIGAARQAICIAQKLAGQSAIPERELANLRDTYGYVLLQTGQIPAAVAELDRAAEVRSDDGDVLFHAAMAHYAAHDDVQAWALLTKATKRMDTPPTHELWTLRAYLNKTILDWNDTLWPVSATTESCRPPG
jgi:tetratricopeptide (TPR) repeat protein